MFYKSHRKSEGRAFDCLYDPLYIVPSTRDIQRESLNALVETAPVNMLTNFTEMLSDSSHRSPCFYLLQQNSLPRLPSFNGTFVFFSATISTIFFFLIHFMPKSFHYGSFTDNTKNSNAKKAIILGSAELQRAKFFNIPLSVTSKSIQRSAMSNDAFTLNENIKVNEQETNTLEKMKNRAIGCQTIYREQSIQTMPYQPDAIAQNDVILSEMIHADDMINDATTIGQCEIDSILEMRKKHQCEKILFDDTTSLDWCKRKTILEAIEWENWLNEENHIESNQLERLKIVEELIVKREHSLHHYKKLKFDESIDRVTEMHQREINKIQ